MKRAKRTMIWLFLSGIPLMTLGCATGPYTIQLRYVAELMKAAPAAPAGLSIGLQAIENFSPERDTLGRRETGTGTEAYISWPKPVAESFTEATELFLRDRGHTVRAVSGWNYKPDTLLQVGTGLGVVVGAHIRRLYCKAEREIGRTNMVIDADMVFFIGDVQQKLVTTKPVKVKVERTEIFFDYMKLERFMNQTLTDLLQTGLGQLP